ncbi:MAG: helix-turn-helix domain-containing protein [Planctomycetota bacterium]|jgi:transcriptional regulator with XRE-family HTH domain
MSTQRNEFAENGLIQVGLRLKEARRARSMTLDDLAKRTELSKGLLSKIENFRSIPSLPVLATLARALSVDMAALVAGIGTATSTSPVLVRATERQVVERDDAVGFLHEALFAQAAGQNYLEVLVLTLDPGATRKLATTDGTQFIFMLQGTVEFQHGEESFILRKGDALSFDGRIPHLPLNPGRQTARFLSVYLLESER